VLAEGDGGYDHPGRPRPRSPAGRRRRAAPLGQDHPRGHHQARAADHQRRLHDSASKQHVGHQPQALERHVRAADRPRRAPRPHLRRQRSSVVNLFTQSQLETLRVFAAQAALFIKNAKLLNELRSESAGLQKRLDNVKFGQIIGACPQMIDVYKRVEKVAGTDISVSSPARPAPARSSSPARSTSAAARPGPLVTVNCGAIPENLIESELFGHVKGAFTGAVANQLGKFQAADKGTIFLDEVGELPLPCRSSSSACCRSASPARRRVQVDPDRRPRGRRDQPRPRQGGRRRPLPRGPLPPPQRHRHPPAAAARARRGRAPDRPLLRRPLRPRVRPPRSTRPRPSTPAEQALLRFNWPGNIRQLENHIKKALVLADGPASPPATSTSSCRCPAAPAARI
jgi:transcriptional regulator of acetoin/glycerol metabolism